MAGSAAVGVRADGDDNVTAAGTKTPTANPPVQAGSTVLNTYGASDLVASESIQGSVGFNMYNEVNLMINEFAKKMANGEGTLEASMVKAYVCRAAEWVTRESMQLHGGMGYAEEFPVSRFFVDARVLSIFEGADETLCLRVIARRLTEQALG